MVEPVRFSPLPNFMHVVMRQWFRQIFPIYSPAQRSLPLNSALSKIKERRAAMNTTAAASRIDGMVSGNVNAH